MLICSRCHSLAFLTDIEVENMSYDETIVKNTTFYMQNKNNIDVLTCKANIRLSLGLFFHCKILDICLKLIKKFQTFYIFFGSKLVSINLQYR